MTVPYNNDTRETYVERQKVNHLAISMLYYEHGHDRAMWQQLFTWAQAEEIYGSHWDKIKEKNNG